MHLSAVENVHARLLFARQLKNFTRYGELQHWSVSAKDVERDKLSPSFFALQLKNFTHFGELQHRPVSAIALKLSAIGRGRREMFNPTRRPKEPTRRPLSVS
jgi:hypothetical protein